MIKEFATPTLRNSIEGRALDAHMNFSLPCKKKITQTGKKYICRKNVMNSRYFHVDYARRIKSVGTRNIQGVGLTVKLRKLIL